MKKIPYLAALTLAVSAAHAVAADFDGSKPLICATISTMECIRGDDCLAGLPEDFGTPAFMRLDFVKMVVVGAKLTSPILLQNKSEGQFLLQGREGSYGWTMALQSERGDMTLTLTNRNAAYVLYGNCTPL